MLTDSTQTIAAISTAMNNSGIGIVRMSGDQAVEIADRVFRGKDHKKLADQKTYTIHYGFIMEGEETIDEVLVMLMRGPHSFTREDTVEINCHGGVYVVKRILDLLIRSGARTAQPGEFTKRAFLNDRMDLSQAEAVSDLINAQSEYALQSSVSQLKGSLKEEIENIRNKIIYNTAYIESALDDPEHISLDGFGSELLSEVRQWQESLQRLIRSADSGKVLTEGIQTVIVGKPNAGKSSLLNVILGEDRAIVTDVAGTTRDALEEKVNLEGILLNIIDTAGIRDTADKVEQIGVERARKYASKADLILYVVDASRDLDENDRAILEIIQDKKAIILLNKTDLETRITKNVIEEYCHAGNDADDKYKEIKKLPIIEISARNNTGIDELETEIKNMFFAGNLLFNDEIYITNARQKEELTLALQSIEKVSESIENSLPEDFYTIDLMDAYEHLGQITGETIGEDLVNEIFGKFCMGK